MVLRRFGRQANSQRTCDYHLCAVAGFMAGKLSVLRSVRQIAAVGSGTRTAADAPAADATPAVEAAPAEEAAK